MNRLVDGEWRTDYQLRDEGGAFQRGETTFRDWIAGSDVPAHVDTEPDDRFQPEAGRYHLYVSYACPWAHRTLVARSLLDLEDAIGVSVVDPWRGEDGWQFTPEKDGCTEDKLYDSSFLRELYVEANPDVSCRVTVPVLWDTEEETIVNNESREIIRQLTTAFADLGNGADLALIDRREEIDRIITEIYEPINNGVYRAGFASEQEPYDEAIDELFGALDHWDEQLADRRYLAGDRLTEADICLFTTLLRFDQVYHTTPTTLRKVRPKLDPQPERWNRITDYQHLHAYLRDLYQTPGVAKTVHLDHIVEHYGCPGSPPGFDPYPVGSVDLQLDAPHDRGRFEN